jgi:hypothetical protein
MAKQHPVTLQASILPGQESQLEALLSTMGNPAGASSFFPFNNFEEVHFARWFVAPGTVMRGEVVPASLIYSANVDGPAAAHLAALTEQAAPALDRILSHCAGYPSGAALTPHARLAFLRAHTLPTQAFFVGARGRTVRQIRQEAELHEALTDYLHAHPEAARSPVSTLTAIRQWLAADRRWDWATKPFRMPVMNWPGFILFLLLMLPLLPFIAILLTLIHLLYENRLTPLGLTINQLNPKRLNQLMDQEDFVYQNQITQVLEIKPGLHQVALRLALWVTNQLARIQFVKGALLGTPTIHFARWVIIDKGRRYLFMSNFDGSYDEYLGDFVDNGGWGLNAIYGNSVGYPRTFFLLGKGAYLIDQFLGWGRYYQVPTQAWYSAYPAFGLPQVNNRSALRAGLFARRLPGEKRLSALLRRI